MNSMNANENLPETVGSSEALRDALNRQALVNGIMRAVPRDGTFEPLKGLHLNRVSQVKEPVHSVTMPSFCVIAQGSKEVSLDTERYQYDSGKYLLATIELPVTNRLVEASPDKPYLGLRLELDAPLVAAVMLEAGAAAPRRATENVRAINVSTLDANLLDAAVRLVRLADAPTNEARVLLPLITREIVFRLLAGQQGARLRHLVVLGGNTDRIARAIARLRTDYNKPLHVESLARDLGMSASGFYEQFKAVTAMSPLQFQKQIRLQEARRLLIGADVDAATAGYRVGYEDASHFSREYKRLFGSPPLRDAARLRVAAAK